MIRTMIIAVFFHLFAFAYAQAPVLNNSTVIMPKSDTLNKCLNADGSIVYTQFECEKTSTKADNAWVENANLTFVMPEKYAVFQEGGPLTMWAKQEQKKNKDKSLEEMIEGKNFIELFNMGIQSYIQRAALLNSL